MKTNMKRATKIIIFLLIVVAFSTGAFLQRSEQVSNKQENMKITSSAFDPEQSIPSKYTCDGKDVNPPLRFEDVPAQAGSLVLVVDDPDAPAGTWLHWTLWNIDSELNKIEEDSVPEGAGEGMTNFGNTGYGGPCPPGKHRYFFKLYALDTKLDLSSSAKVKHLENAMEDNIIEKAKLVGIYER